MKVELISMQRVYNHGSFLQAYGLKMLINKYADDVRYADLKAGIKNNSFCKKFNEISKIPAYQKNKIRIIEKLQKIIHSYGQKNILKVDYHFSDEEEKNIAFIGSDEMFNCLAESSWGVSEQLFGKVYNCNSVVTYAVSCGHTKYEDLPSDIIIYIQAAMKNLNRISVRDYNTYEFVLKLTGQNAIFNLDPVLIYDFEKEIVEPRFKKKYLLVYSYTNRINEKIEIQQIKSFAKEKNLCIVGAGVFQYWCDYNIPVTSFKLLGYFKNAEYVVTDTFHGAVLSIKYNKQFTVFIRESNNNKLTDLLKRLGQLSRRVNDINKFCDIMNTTINYSITNRIIADEKNKTDRYIKDCIREAEYKD